MKKIFLFFLLSTSSQIKSSSSCSEQYEPILMKLMNKTEAKTQEAFHALHDSNMLKIENFEDDIYLSSKFWLSSTDPKIEDPELVESKPIERPKKNDRNANSLKNRARIMAEFLDGKSDLFPISSENDFFQTNLSWLLDNRSLPVVRQTIENYIKNYFAELTFEDPSYDISESTKSLLKQTMEIYNQNDLIMHWLNNRNQHLNVEKEKSFSQMEIEDILSFIKSISEMDTKRRFNDISLGSNRWNSQKNISLIKSYISSGAKEFLDQLRAEPNENIRKNLGIVIRIIKNHLGLFSRVCTRPSGRLALEGFKTITGKSISELVDANETPWFISDNLFERFKLMVPKKQSQQSEETAIEEQPEETAIEESWDWYYNGYSQNMGYSRSYPSNHFNYPGYGQDSWRNYQQYHRSYR